METTRTQEEIRNEMLTYFEEHNEDFEDVIEQLDGYNGLLGDDRYYNMEDFDELHTGLTPMEVLERTFYGGDDDTRDKNGTRGEFNPNRNYFYYNGYGNLCSTDYKDYTDHLDEYFLDEIIENRNYLDYLPTDIIELLDELEELEEN